MSSDKVLSFEFISWPQSKFILDVAEKLGSNLSVEVRNGAYRNVRVDLYDADIPNARPLKTNMDKRGKDFIHDKLGCNQVVGARSGLITQGGFMPVLGAGKRTVPLPDIGLHKRFRLEIIGPTWDDLIGGAPVPATYHTSRKANLGVYLSQWQALTMTTISIEVLIALISIALGSSGMIHEDHPYLDSFGESWRSNGSIDQPKGPNFPILLFVLFKDAIGGNSVTSTTYTLLYDLIKAFLELLVAPNPNLTYFPAGVREKIKAQVLRAREQLLRRIAKHNRGKLIAKANVYVKIISLAVDSAEFYTVYNSLNAVDTKHDVIIEFKKDKTALSVNPEPIIASKNGWLGLPKAQFSWFKLPITGNVQLNSTFINWDTSHTNVSCVANFEINNPERITLTDIVADGEPVPLILYLEPKPSLNPISQSADLISAGLIERTDPNQTVIINNTPGLPPLFTAKENGEGTLSVTIINLDHADFYRSEAQSETLREINFKVDNQLPLVEFTLRSLALSVGEFRALEFSITFKNGAVFNSIEPFSGFVQIRADGAELAIHDLTISLINPWTNEESEFTFPDSLVFKIKNINSDTEGGSGDHAKFNWPEIESSDYFSEHYLNLGEIVEGVSWGYAQIQLFIESTALIGDHDYEEGSRPHISLEVSRTQIETELVSLHDPDGENKLVIEGGEDLNEALFGEVYFQITALDRVLYKSDREALLIGSASASELQIYFTEIYQQDHNDEYVRAPFHLTLSFRDPDIVKFTLEHNASIALGSFEFVGTLEHFIQAVGGGSTELVLQLRSLSTDEQDNFAEYNMPDAERLTVFVPPPLEVELFDYTDVQGLVDLNSAGDRRELIHRRGTLNGEILNHQHWPSGENVSENIMLILNGVEQDLTPDLDQNGYFAVEIPIELGINEISVSATKPIHNTMGLSPARKDETLIGVAPKIEGYENVNGLFLDSETGDYYLKKMGTISFGVRFGRSLEGFVQVVTQATQDQSSTFSSFANLPASYEMIMHDTTTSFVPNNIATLHSILTICTNELDDTQFSLSFNTRAELINHPGVGERFQIFPEGYYLENEPTQVGFDTEYVRIEVLASCTSEIICKNSTTGDTQRMDLGDSYVASATFRVRVVTGHNSINITVSNDFGSANYLTFIDRRDNVYNRRNVEISVSRLTDHTITIDCYIDGQQYNRSIGTDRTTEVFSIEDIEGSFDEAMQVSLKWWFSDGGLCRLICIGTIMGPNYEIYNVGFPMFEGEVVWDDWEIELMDPNTLSDIAWPGFEQDIWNQLNEYFDMAIYQSCITKLTSGSNARALFTAPRQPGSSS